HLGAGAYICGEESALIESLEGKPGKPRIRPPFPVTNGYMGQPTTVNNVETLALAALIAVRGGEWFRAIGTAASTGTKLLSVSGDVERPGRSEEHTSELQSRENLVCRLLLEKKKRIRQQKTCDTS